METPEVRVGYKNEILRTPMKIDCENLYEEGYKTQARIVEIILASFSLYPTRRYLLMQPGDVQYSGYIVLYSNSIGEILRERIGSVFVNRDGVISISTLDSIHLISLARVDNPEAVMAFMSSAVERKDAKFGDVCYYTVPFENRL